MEKSKVSQKICKECNTNNPIRCFHCKECGNAFDQKPKKEDNNKTKGKDKDKNKSDSAAGKKDKNTSIKSFFTGNKQHANIPIPVPQIIDNKTNDFINRILDICDITILCEQSIFDIKDFINLENEDENENKSEIDTFNFVDFDIEKGYSCNFTKYNNIIHGIIAYCNTKIDKFIITCLEIELSKENKPVIINKNFLLLKTYQYMIFSVKFLENSPFFSLSLNNTLSLYIYHKNNIIIISNLSTKENISHFDLTLTNDRINLILADYDNTIYYYKSSIVNKSVKFTLSCIYEKCFNAKMTDLKFLFHEENIKGLNNVLFSNNYFCATSRDGSLKIYNTVNHSCPIFKYKTTEIWITKFIYDNTNKILYFLVNLEEKVFGIKFYPDKEPLIKRIPATENIVSCKYNHNDDKLYCMGYDGIVKNIDSSNIVGLFTNYRSKSKKTLEVEEIVKIEGKKNFPYNFFVFSIGGGEKNIFFVQNLDRINISIK